MQLGLTSRVALITGGSRGIGKGIAEQLANEGADLVLVARNSDALADIAGNIASRHDVRVRTIVADLSDPETPVRLAREAGPIDILVNNANTPSGGSLEGLSEAEWQRNWSVKPYGYIRMLRAFVPMMRERGSGVIINMIGQINQVATNKALFSAASCSSLTTITQALAHELAQCGVRIVGVGAWVVNTESVVQGYREKAVSKLGDASRWRELLTHLPFGRAAEPAEIGDLVAFLASDRARYISGQIINVDGGYIASSVPTLVAGALAHE